MNIREDGTATTVDLSRAEWRKASASQGGGECVEAAFLDGAVALRDSKDPQGAVLVFTPGEWSAFTCGVRDGEFDR